MWQLETGSAELTSWYHPGLTESISVTALLTNKHSFLIFKILFELDNPISGWGWSPSYQVGSVKEINLGLFALVYMITILFMFFSFKQIKDMRWQYLSSIWNWFDIVNLGLFIASFVLSIMFTSGYTTATETPNENVDADTIFRLMQLSSMQRNIMYLYGINMLIMNFKLIKYLQACDFIPGLAMPIAALQEAGIEMFAFMFTLIITCLGFAQTFTAWYGDQVRDYNTSARSFVTMLLALTGYPNFEDLGSGSWQHTMQRTGVVVLSIYCYFFIFFFLVMLVAIQLVAYNKVRHQFLRAGKRFMTFRQFCKLLRKRYRLAKVEVEEEHGGKWCTYFKLQLRQYYQDNFADLSNQGHEKDTQDLGPGECKLPLYASTRLANEAHSMRLLESMTEMYNALDLVLEKVSQEVEDVAIDNNLSTEGKTGKESCLTRCFGTKEADLEPEPETEAKPEDEPKEYQTGEQLSMSREAANNALNLLEGLEHEIQDVVFQQQSQQSNILKSCDNIMSWTASIK